jgi:hypothetical protein
MIGRSSLGRWLILPAALLGLANANARAGIIDLTTAGATGSGTAFIGGTFQVQQVPPQPTGTGFIDSFVRLQPGGSTNAEQGFNTSLATHYDELGGNFTRALTLGEVPIVTFQGQQYRQFLLDINQNGANPKLSLNQVQIFLAAADRNNDTLVSTAAAGTNAVTSFPGTPTATLVFQMSNANAGAANAFEVQLDFSLNSGSGSGDMFLYVPVADFAGGTDSTNVILFSQFGNPPGAFATNDGFEEWAVLKGAAPPGVVPEPATIALAVSGLATFGFAGLRRLRRRPADLTA